MRCHNYIHEKCCNHNLLLASLMPRPLVRGGVWARDYLLANCVSVAVLSWLAYAKASFPGHSSPVVWDWPKNEATKAVKSTVAASGPVLLIKIWRWMKVNKN